MAVHIKFETDSAAFDDGNKGAEIARILRRIAAQVGTLDGEDDVVLPVRDINGNKIGSVVVSGD